MWYFARRLAVAAALVFVVSSGALVFARLAPGDYALESLGPGARPETVAATRARLGLDRSLAATYIDWLGRAVRFDFGRSFAYDRPVRDLLAERAGNTALLALTALILATALGIPLGVVSGASPRGLAARAIRWGSVAMLSMPPLLTSLLLVFIAARTGWLPIGGMQSLASDGLSGGPGSAAAVFDRVRHLVVPVLAIALPMAALLERLQSQSMSEALGQPFLRAVIARGVPRDRAVWRHAFRIALLPIASLYGVIAGTLLSGSFVVEIVTAWPGLGRLMLDALQQRDVYVVAGCAATGALFLAVGTLLSDVAAAALDPRIRE